MTISYEDVIFATKEQQDVVEKYYWDLGWVFDYQDDKKKTIYLLNWNDDKKTIVDGIAVYSNGEFIHT